MSKWDKRFLKLAREVSTWSKDPSTQVGAVIVRPDKSVASLGFNGFAKNMIDHPEQYANRENKYSRIIHAEMNALLLSQDRLHQGYTLYTWPLASCERCFVHMVQAGITRFVFPPLPKSVKARWESSIDKIKVYADEAKVTLLELEI